ncbi:hypothetical protein AWC38_SpisGene17458 [Stylophora pistillata]|uniref:Uncharacterized protein n=1 Tax=Stylophora pistillata TaxID=50429 RepID=A0A2B4RP96_STYPI|nr:hypothetical protein AWC38_SpisGene17458 [Stylophora pistillata]
MLTAMKGNIEKKGSQGVYSNLTGRRQVVFLGLLPCLTYHVESSRYTTPSLERQQGILDAIDQDDLRDRLESSKSEMEDRERELLKRLDETYTPKFWPYLKERSDMMARHMVEKVRKEAGMGVGDDGKLLRCQLNKIQFTQNVFEVVHAKQIDEMHSAIAGVSDEYTLADHARYLQVPAYVWFEWTPEMRKDYVLGTQKLSVNDVFKQKDLPWPSFESSRADETKEFRSLDILFN